MYLKWNFQIIIVSFYFKQYISHLSTLTAPSFFSCSSGGNIPVEVVSSPSLSHFGKSTQEKKSSLNHLRSSKSKRSRSLASFVSGFLETSFSNCLSARPSSSDFGMCFNASCWMDWSSKVRTNLSSFSSLAKKSLSDSLGEETLKPGSQIFYMQYIILPTP